MKYVPEPPIRSWRDKKFGVSNLTTNPEEYIDANIQLAFYAADIVGPILHRREAFDPHPSTHPVHRNTEYVTLSLTQIELIDPTRYDERLRTVFDTYISPQLRRRTHSVGLEQLAEEAISAMQHHLDAPWGQTPPQLKEAHLALHNLKENQDTTVEPLKNTIQQYFNALYTRRFPGDFQKNHHNRTT